MNLRSLSVAAVLIAVIPACKPKKLAESNGPSSEATTNAATLPSAAAPALSPSDNPQRVPGAIAFTQPNMGIGERFQVEATSRPTISPNADAIFAAFEKNGVTIDEKKQHLGAIFGARYCLGARAVSGDKTLLHISVCEFISDEVAEKSRVASNALNERIPDRSVMARKQTTLTVRQETKSPESDTALEKVRSTYTSL